MENNYVVLALLVVTIILSAFFSGMESAFLNKNRLRLEIDRKQSRMFDYIAGLFSREQGQYITTILVGNNIALVLYSMCLSQLLRSLASHLGLVEVENGSILLETIVPTILIIFLGEYLPKSMFGGNPNFFYRYLSPVMWVRCRCRANNSNYKQSHRWLCHRCVKDRRAVWRTTMLYWRCWW